MHWLCRFDFRSGKTLRLSFVRNGRSCSVRVQCNQGRRWVVQYGDWSDEPVASPGQRLYEARIVGVIPQRLANLINGGSKRVIEVDVGPFFPDSLLKLLASDDLSGPLNQFSQHSEGLPLNLDPETTPPKLSRGEIRLKRTKGNSYGI